MDKFLWLCFIVPVMAAGMVLHLKMKGQVKAAGYDHAQRIGDTGTADVVYYSQMFVHMDGSIYGGSGPVAAKDRYI